MTVRKVKLGDLIEINPRSNYSLASDSNIAFLAMADISEDGQILATQTRPLSEVAKGYTSFKNGDVLLAKITPCFENGKAALVHGMFSEVAFGSTEFHVLRPTEEIDGRYLYHLVWNPAFRAAGARRMTGSAGQKRVPAAYLSDFEIALPRFEEQKRIATILDKADSLRRKRQQAIRLADDFLRAVFVDMFGKRDRNAALGDYVDVLSGFAFKSENYIGSSGVRLLRGINVGISDCEWKDTAFYPQALTQELGRYELLEGDVVLAMDRPWISDGLKCAVINKDVAGSLLVQRVARLRAKSIPCAQFVHQCLVDAEFQRHCRVTETTIPHISPTDLATYPIPKASPQELEKFAAIAAKVAAFVRSGSEGNERIQSLALSLQSALLS